MRIRILETVATVGEMLEEGKVYEVQPTLAEALIARGQAEDFCNSCVAEVVPEVELEAEPVAVVEDEPEPAPEEAEEPEPKPKKVKAPKK